MLLAATWLCEYYNGQKDKPRQQHTQSKSQYFFSTVCIMVLTQHHSTTSQNGGEALHCTAVIDLGKQNHGKSKSRTAKASQGTAGHDAHTLYYSGTCPAPAHRKTIWHFRKLDALPSFLPVAIHSCRSFCLAFDLATVPGGPLNRNNIKIFRTYSNSPASSCSMWLCRLV